MRPLFVVAAKEIRENLRDRRTLVSALLFGPLFGPLLFALLMTLTLDRALGRFDRPLVLAVTGVEHAPNLVGFLEENGVSTRTGPAGFEAARIAVQDGHEELVLVIPTNYPQRLVAGQPAPVELLWDSSNNRVAPDAGRVRALLEGYSRQLAALRLQARGMSPLAVMPLDVRNVDVSTPAGRSVLVLGMMTYLILFATLMGGLYLAIDTTAGERERGSLEALLTLPVGRSELIAGKILATAFFMLLSLVLTVTAFSVSLAWVPLERLGMSANFGPRIAIAVVGIMLPFVPLGAALMTVIASFTRTYKEAQTWVTLVLLVPTLPILIAGLYSLRTTSTLMLVPSLSQHLLITRLLRGETVEAVHYAISTGATLALGAALVWLAMRLYRREAILG